VLKEGDEVLVQVTKDAMGAKGARLTGVPSLPGRYLVLVPDSDSVGISRRLPDGDRNQRLREVINKVRPTDFGVIVRTAALHATDEELAADISRLTKQWDRSRSRHRTVTPRLIHEEPELLIKVIREHFTADFRKLMIDDQEAYDLVVMTI
jgi:ribonuclease E